MPEARPARVFARATRIKTVPLIVVPVAVGTALGAARAGAVSWGWFTVAAAGAVLAHLSANVLNDVFDAGTGADRIAGMDRTAIVTASGLIDDGTMTPRAMTILAAALAAPAVGAGVALAAARGAGVLVPMVMGAALAVFYAGPPVRYGYVGHGLGEAGQVAAYGILPVAGAAFVQVQRFEPDLWWAGLGPGLLTMLVFHHHNLLHHRADKAVGKRTPVAVLGAESGLLLSAALIPAAYATIAIQVALGLFPAPALAVFLTAVPVLSSWTRAFRDPNPQRVLNLLGASLGASVLAGSWLAVAVAVWG